MATVLTGAAEAGFGARPASPAVARATILASIALAAAAALLATSPAESARAIVDADLTRLLRFMALLKAGMAAAALAAVLWRLGVPVLPFRLAAYAAAGAAMAAGPVLVWSMAHVGLGALLLHGGLLAAIVLLWRDPAVAGRLASLVAIRRRRR